MSYQVLARKWRPRNFQEMVGQEHALRMLTNALTNQRLHHAYLFTGTRGVGKTTLARILAKCLNCEQGISAAPCGQCSACQTIDAGRFPDLIEIDAASRTKVEDTREILDNVQYAPFQGRYKIYLIDEVHMLSGHSFNALLKTLEEPPAHVKFLLATTDPKRLPITILSRCLQFNLKRVPVEQISAQLQHICKTENIVFEESALHLVAQAADGSMRDALSLLDQAIAYCHEKISTSETRNMLGSIEHDAIYRLLHSLAAQNGKQLLDEITLLNEHAPDFNQVLEELLTILHQISVTQVVPDYSKTSETISQFAKQFSAEEVQLYYQIALIGRRDLPLASSPRQGFEMVMLRMLAFRPVAENPTGKSGIKDKAPVASTPSIVSTSPMQASAGGTPAMNLTAVPARNIPAINSSTANIPAVKNPIVSAPVTTSTTQASTNWTDIITHLKLTGLAYHLATHCTLIKSENNHIVLALAKKHEPMFNKKLQDRLEQALRDHFQQPIKLEINITEETIETPAKQHEEAQAQRHANAAEAIKNDTTVQKMLELFGGSIDMSSVKAV